MRHRILILSGAMRKVFCRLLGNVLKSTEHSPQAFPSVSSYDDEKSVMKNTLPIGISWVVTKVEYYVRDIRNPTFYVYSHIAEDFIYI
jgi:hypothetical protein